MIGVLLAIALLLYAFALQEERFANPSNIKIEEGTEVEKATRPTRNADWLSKIDSEAPIGGNDDDYIRVLQSFYDDVYAPKEKKVTDKDVEAFIQSPAIAGTSVDVPALRKIITRGFKAEITTTVAARLKKEMKFEPTEALFPKNGVDEVRTRKEAEYVPADTRTSTEFSEGVYAPVPQQNVPRNPGEYKERSVGWTKQKFYSVCKGSDCSENVL